MDYVQFTDQELNNKIERLDIVCEELMNKVRSLSREVLVDKQNGDFENANEKEQGQEELHGWVQAFYSESEDIANEVEKRKRNRS